MSKNVKLATLSVVVVAGLLVAHFAGYLPMQITEPTTDTAQVATETPVIASTTQPQSSGEETTSEEPAIDPEDVDPASIDWEGVTERAFPGIDQMILRWDLPVDYSQEEIAAFNKLHVIPFNPRVDQVCYDHDTGINGVGE